MYKNIFSSDPKGFAKEPLGESEFSGPTKYVSLKNFDLFIDFFFFNLQMQMK